MKAAVRDSLFQYAREQYDAEPEYLWERYPNYAVLRHPGSKKWFAVIMDVPRKKLGLDGAGTVDVADVKCPPVMAGSLRDGRRYFPAYHMNKENWLSVLLDGSVALQELYALLDMSVQLTGKKSRRSK